MKTGSILTQPVKDMFKKLGMHESFNLERNWEIYTRLQNGERLTDLGKEYGITKQRIIDIRRALNKKVEIIKKQGLEI